MAVQVCAGRGPLLLRRPVHANGFANSIVCVCACTCQDDSLEPHRDQLDPVPFCLCSAAACVCLQCLLAPNTCMCAASRSRLLKSWLDRVMARAPQAAALASAWANEEELAALGAKQSLCQVTAKKLSRSALPAHSARMHKRSPEFKHDHKHVARTRTKACMRAHMP